MSKDFRNFAPYGKTMEERQRFASFIATTNNRRPLVDPTGSRRFVCVYADEIDNHALQSAPIATYSVESGHGSNSSSNSHHAPWLEACSPFDGGLPGFDTPKPSRRMGCE